MATLEEKKLEAKRLQAEALIKEQLENAKPRTFKFELVPGMPPLELEDSPSVRALMATAEGADAINRGLLSIAPDSVRDWFAETLGIGRDRRDDSVLPEYVDRGLEFVGEALPYAAGSVALGGTKAVAKGAQLAGQGIGSKAVRGGSKALQETSKFAATNPGKFAAVEGAGAFGAGVAGHIAEEEGAGPWGQLGAEVAGGVAGGMVPGLAKRGTERAWEGIKGNLLPFTEAGASIRAAKQMQATAGGAERASRLVELLNDIPEGVTPAQWIGDDDLMGLESRILKDNPALREQVFNNLAKVRLASENALRNFAGKPATTRQWLESVLKVATPEGTVIKPNSQDKMLNEAYESFKPHYDSAKGSDVFIEKQDVLRKPSNIIKSRNIIADNSSRRQIEAWLKNMFSAYKKEITIKKPPKGEGGKIRTQKRLVWPEIISTDKLLKMRSEVRKQDRLQRSYGEYAKSDLLSAIDDALSDLIYEGLPDDVVENLIATDLKYKQYKVVEDAVYNAGIEKVTAEDLDAAIKNGGIITPSRYARGVDEVTEGLKALGRLGVAPEKLVGDPDWARDVVRGANDVEKRRIQAAFIDTLFKQARTGQVSESGVKFISGEKLFADILENKKVFTALGMSDKDFDRLDSMVQTARRLSKHSPLEVEKIMADGPAAILQLGATLIGAQSGGRMADNIGSSLVLSGWMAKGARSRLATITSNKAEQLIIDAATDPKLYRALMTKKTAKTAIKRENAKYLQAWLYASAASDREEEE